MKLKTINKMRLLTVFGAVFAVILFAAISLLNANATVKAEDGDSSAANTHTHCICGGNVAIGDHTDHLPVTFSPYGGGNFDYDGADSGVAYLYLTQDVVNNANSSNRVDGDGILSIKYGQTLYLCLNGHSLKNALTGNNVIDVKGTLYLCDCAGGGTIGGRKSGSNSGAVWVSGGEFYMYGGVITGSHGLKNGGGVFLKKEDINKTDFRSSQFYMYGGAVTDNSVTRRGGGVYLSDNGSFFTMYGGEISDNASPESGGGVIMNGGTFNMHGGVIKNNRSGSFGGGVFASGGEFNMDDGEISGNTAANGGGVCVTTGNGRGTFNMGGGKICGNTAINGGGVYVWDNASFNVTDGAITDNGATYGGGVCMYSANEDESSGSGDKNNVFRIAKGEIKNNTASAYGGGVCCFERSNVEFLGSGVITVSENENGNFYLADNGCALHINYIKNGSLIGVSSIEKPEKGSPKRVFKTTTSLETYGEYFFSDNENYALEYKTDRINLTADCHKSTLKYVTGCDKTIPNVVKTDLTNESIAFTVTDVAPSAACRTFKGWASTADAIAAEYAAGDTLTVTGEATLYAVWEAAAHTLTEVSKVEATCEKDGVKGYFACSECGKKFVDVSGAKVEVSEDSELKISGGHKFGAWQEKVEATAEKEGVLAHKDCEKCGKHFDINGNEIANLTIEKLPAQPANEQKGGLSSGAVAGISVGATAASVLGIEALAYAIFKIISKKRRLK